MNHLVTLSFLKSMPLSLTFWCVVNFDAELGGPAASLKFWIFRLRRWNRDRARRPKIFFSFFHPGYSSVLVLQKFLLSHAVKLLSGCLSESWRSKRQKITAKEHFLALPESSSNVFYVIDCHGSGKNLTAKGKRFWEKQYINIVFAYISAFKEKSVETRHISAHRLFTFVSQCILSWMTKPKGL